MLAPDLDAALTGARLVEEAGALLTLGEEPERMVAHAFERLGQLVPYDLATVLLKEGDRLRVAHAVGPLATEMTSPRARTTSGSYLVPEPSSIWLYTTTAECRICRWSR